MALTLYYGSGSPYSWRVQLALGHKGIDYEPRLLSFSKGEHRTPEMLKRNPRGRVPVLDDDGFSLYESAAIVEYLEERFPDRPALFPGDTRARALVRREREEADAYFGAPSEVLSGELFFKPREQWERPRIDRARAELFEELARREGALDGEFLAGPLSAADFTLYPFVALMARHELKDPTLELTRAVGPKLRAWMQRIEALPYFEATYPPHWRS